MRGKRSGIHERPCVIDEIGDHSRVPGDYGSMAAGSFAKCMNAAEQGRVAFEIESGKYSCASFCFVIICDFVAVDSIILR
mmetsp:Transcript_4792/g.8625  ORF Transcript_4792/g.8625 Transcript_4792/m.8625 type:complete len:80 (-) Transcript_4792:46-285(-)